MAIVLILLGVYVVAKHCRRYNKSWYERNKFVQKELQELRSSVPLVQVPKYSWRWLEWQLRMPIVWIVRLLGWWACDLWKWFWKHENDFDLFGCHVYASPQGAGKTISLVNKMLEIRMKYPRAIIVSNFDCEYAHVRMTDWKDFFAIRNGENGVAFFIDEIQNEWTATAWAQFPPEMLSELTQQRKQRMVIYASSQQFLRIVKPIRDQSFSVIEVRTFLGRLCLQAGYDAFAYEAYYSLPPDSREKRLKRKYILPFVQNHQLRGRYDTYSKVQRLENTLAPDGHALRGKSSK